MVLIMEKTIKKIVLGAAFILASGGLFGQRNVLRYADIEYDLKRFEHAGSQYAEAYSLKQTYYSAKRAAESYSLIKSYQKAFEWWDKTVKFSESDREDYLNYARSAVQAGQSLTDLGITLTEEERYKVHGGVFVPEDETIEFRAVDKYNSAGTDYGLRSDLEGRNYFVSDRNLNEETQKKSIRLDARKRFSGDDRYRMNDRGFHQILMEGEEGIVQVSTELEGVYHLSTPAFYENGAVQQAIFTAVLRDDKGRKTRRHEVHPGIYTATVQSDGSFGKVKALPFNKLSEYGVMHGVVYNDRLYFSSDMPGGYGGYDLYYTEILGDSYGPAINLGSKVNGAYDEVFPYLHEGKLYFSSDRTSGLGGLDIYSIDAELSGQAVNMGKPYNTAQDDFAFYVDANGLQYLSSDRGMSESRDDIYSLAFLRDLYRLRVFAESGERLDGMEGLQLQVLDANGQEVTMDIQDGKIGRLKEGAYTVEIRKKGYFPARVPLTALAADGAEKELDYTLVPIPYGKMLAIDTIYYDFDKYNIRPDAAEVLDRASAVLGAYPEFNLNITSHTDARASNAYNESLSQNRSNSAATYLKGTGVAGERLSTAWKGEQQPVNPCLDGVDCPESMHDRNRRSILSLELYPDFDGDYSLPGDLSYVKSTDELMEAIASMVREKQASLLPLILAEDMVYYDLDKYEIRPDAAKVLKAAEDLLKKYPFLKLEIASHTDSRQTLLYNDRLSKNRSMAVFFHLRNKGIAGTRMGVSWYSETKLVTSCPDGVDCTEEQHQLNRRSVLQLKVDRSDVDKIPAAWRTGRANFADLLK
jgi:outer membrane protein OmpA-like peptidoglycan-associated protein